MLKPEIMEAVRLVATRFEVPVWNAAAVVDQESLGEPFEWANESIPHFLFERHKFYQQLPEAMRAGAVAAGLALAKRSPRTQYKDQYVSADRIDLLNAATEYGGQEIAYRACSWGLMQVMGFNYEDAGYRSAVDMVRSFGTVGGQLEGAFRFMSVPMLRAMRWGDFKTFARLYNGPSYADNQYDIKIAKLAEFYKGRLK